MSIYGKAKFIQSLVQGFKTSRKIIVIESDDWGSERIPSATVRTQLNAVGVDVTTNPHSRYDTLERVEDLEIIENLLNWFEREYDKKVRITANFITANPDFCQIEKDNFQNYRYESFTETYRKRDGHTKVIENMKSLISSGKIMPQFHGREHINAEFWLEELRLNNEKFKLAFDLRCFGIDAPSEGKHRKNLMAAFEYQTKKQKDSVRTSINEGLQQFEDAFGFPSTTIIAPRYVWNSDLESDFASLGIKHIQSTFYQQEPTDSGYRKKFHYTGQTSKKSGLNYLVRNAYFEPAYKGNVDWVYATLKNIKMAFKFRTPAIISMHRINFVGGLDSNVRDKNMNQFRILLVEIIKKYPEVEFMTSDELGKIIKEKYVRN